MTDIPLRDYFERRLLDLESHVTLRMDRADAEVSKAERMMNERLAGMNGIKSMAADQGRLMATRTEVDVAFKNLQRQLDAASEIVNTLRRDKANMDGRLIVVAALASMLMSGLVAGIARLIQ